MRQRYAFGSFAMVIDEGAGPDPTGSGRPILRTVAILAGANEAP